MNRHQLAIKLFDGVMLFAVFYFITRVIFTPTPVLAEDVLIKLIHDKEMGAEMIQGVDGRWYHLQPSDAIAPMPALLPVPVQVLTPVPPQSLAPEQLTLTAFGWGNAEFGYFPPEPAPTIAPAAPAVPAELVEYIAQTRPDIAEDRAARIVAARERAITEFGLPRDKAADPTKMGCVAKFESSFELEARNPLTDCAGMFQIHPCHIGSMKKLGLDWNKEEDREVYAYLLEFWQGLGPWAVKYDALRDYNRIRSH